MKSEHPWCSILAKCLANRDDRNGAVSSESSFWTSAHAGGCVKRSWARQDRVDLARNFQGHCHQNSDPLLH